LERHFEHDLEALKQQLLLMGGRVETIIHKAIEALERRNSTLAAEVFTEDQIIDRLEVEIEERCVNLLALQQPLARDLRFITAALKINNDLERVGDHAVNIAGSAVRLAETEPLTRLEEIPRMATLAAGMLHEALDAFVGRDAATARRLVLRDDAVDQLNRQIFRALITHMIANPATIPQAMERILVARNLERVADLATNIAEEVVFIAEARIIKHHAEEWSAPAAEPRQRPERPGDDFGRT